MAITKPRTRLVYFRISENEYEQILRLCEVTGARSISDLARSAIQKLIFAEPQAEDDLQRTKMALESLLAELRTNVQRLTSFETSQDNGGREPLRRETI